MTDHGFGSDIQPPPPPTDGAGAEESGPKEGADFTTEEAAASEWEDPQDGGNGAPELNETRDEADGDSDQESRRPPEGAEFSEEDFRDDNAAEDSTRNDDTADDNTEDDDFGDDRPDAEDPSTPEPAEPDRPTPSPEPVEAAKDAGPEADQQADEPTAAQSDQDVRPYAEQREQSEQPEQPEQPEPQRPDGRQGAADDQPVSADDGKAGDSDATTEPPDAEQGIDSSPQGASPADQAAGPAQDEAGPPEGASGESGSAESDVSRPEGTEPQQTQDLADPQHGADARPEGSRQPSPSTEKSESDTGAEVDPVIETAAEVATTVIETAADTAGALGAAVDASLAEGAVTGEVDQASTDSSGQSTEAGTERISESDPPPESDSRDVETTLADARISELESQGHGPQRHLHPTTEALKKRTGDPKIVDGNVALRPNGHVKTIDHVNPETGKKMDIMPDGTEKPHFCGAYATKFKNKEDYVQAEAYLREKAINESDSTPTATIEEIFGPGDHSHRFEGYYVDPNSTFGMDGSVNHLPVDFSGGFIKAKYDQKETDIALNTLFADPRPGQHP